MEERKTCNTLHRANRHVPVISRGMVADVVKQTREGAMRGEVCASETRGSVYFGGDENSSSGTSKSIATSLLGQKRAAGRARKKRRLRARVHVPGPLLFRPFSTLSVSTRRADDGAKTAGAPWRDRSLAAVHRRLIETPFAPTEKHRELAMSDYGSDHEDDTEHTLANVGFPRAWTILF